MHLIGVAIFLAVIVGGVVWLRRAFLGR